jgi:hypothetical protein
MLNAGDFRIFCELMLDIVLGNNTEIPEIQKKLTYIICNKENKQEEKVSIFTKKIRIIVKYINSPRIKCEIRALILNSQTYRDKISFQCDQRVSNQDKLLECIPSIIKARESDLSSQIRKFYTLLNSNKQSGFVREIDDWGLVVFNSARNIYRKIQNTKIN